jgi:hypothetical protein
MTELQKVLLTSGLTVFAGVVIFVIGQIFVKLALEPIQELRKLIGAIAHSLAFFANQIYLPGPKRDEAMETYRQQACRIREALEMIPSPFYKLARCFQILPPKTDVAKASAHLIGLSNFNNQKDNRPEYKDIIEDLLRIQKY